MKETSEVSPSHARTQWVSCFLVKDAAVEESFRVFDDVRSHFRRHVSYSLHITSEEIVEI